MVQLQRVVKPLIDIIIYRKTRSVKQYETRLLHRFGYGKNADRIIGAFIYSTKRKPRKVAALLERIADALQGLVIVKDTFINTK